MRRAVVDVEVLADPQQRARIGLRHDIAEAAADMRDEVGGHGTGGEFRRPPAMFADQHDAGLVLQLVGPAVRAADIDEVVEQFGATRDVCSFAYPDEFYGENVGLAVVLEDRSEETVLGDFADAARQAAAALREGINQHRRRG